MLSWFDCVWLFVTLCTSLPSSSGRRILQARTRGWVAMPSSRVSSLIQGSNPGLLHQQVDSLCVCCHFSCVWLFETLWPIAHQAPMSIRFSRQEYWTELPCPPPGDLPDPGIEQRLLWLWHCRRTSLLPRHQGSPGADLYHLECAFALFYMKYLTVTIFYKAQHS